MARTRSITNALGRLLASSSRPMYVLDDQRAIIYVNQALLDWVALDQEDLIGVRCDYHSSADAGTAREAAARLCPPAEVFLGQSMAGEVSRSNKAGKLSRRRAEFISLATGPLDSAGTIVVVQSVDVRETTDSPNGDAPASPAELHRQLLSLRQKTVARYGIDHLMGESPSSDRIRRQVQAAHRARAGCLVIGPAGSGREHVARAVHYGKDPEGASRLVPVACALMDPELMQSTLTNVVRHHEDEQQPPALLLQEVDQLPESAQHELVNFLKLPGIELETVATARADLLQMAKQGEFLEDLAASLCTIVIQLPPLVQRPEDIPVLAQAMLEQLNAKGGRQLSGFTDQALNRLVAYPWPGNSDELAELVSEAFYEASGTLIDSGDLPDRIRHAADAAAHPRQTEETIVLDDFLSEIEQELIRRALKQAKGNKTKAAHLLGVTRARLHRRLDQMGLNQRAQPGSDDVGEAIQFDEAE